MKQKHTVCGHLFQEFFFYCQKNYEKSIKTLASGKISDIISWLTKY